MRHTAAWQPEALEVGGAGWGGGQRDLEASISWVYIVSPSQSADKSPTTWATAPGTHQKLHTPTPTHTTGGEEGQRELSSSMTVVTPPNLKEINILPDEELGGKN